MLHLSISISSLFLVPLSTAVIPLEPNEKAGVVEGKKIPCGWISLPVVTTALTCHESVTSGNTLAWYTLHMCSRWEPSLNLKPQHETCPPSTLNRPMWASSSENLHTEPKLAKANPHDQAQAACITESVVYVLSYSVHNILHLYHSTVLWGTL